MTKKKAAALYLAVSLAILGAKSYAFILTHSRAVFSDAAESIVNVIAGVVSLIVIFVASLPADRNHPYGHGKAEYLSSAFEGGLLTFAAVSIFVSSIDAWVRGIELRELDIGLWIMVAAGVVNAFLGLYLGHVGRKLGSPALEASGKHVLSDFWTSAGVVASLFLVTLTGVIWIDPMVACIVATYLGWTGFRVVRHSTGGLMDEEDRGVIERLGELFSKHSFPGIIRIHYLRVIRSGNQHHVDAHLVVPEFWSVNESHDHTNRFEKLVMTDYGPSGEIHFHLDPCRRAYCEVCDYPNCPVRRRAFKGRLPFSLEELTSPTEPERFYS